MAMSTWQRLHRTAMSNAIVDFGSITSLVINLLVLGQRLTSNIFLCVVVFLLDRGAILIGFHHAIVLLRNYFIHLFGKVTKDD